MTALQRYIADEIATDHVDGLLTRREAPDSPKPTASESPTGAAQPPGAANTLPTAAIASAGSQGRLPDWFGRYLAGE